jgi:3-methyladenine DNA glycosylase/8-oxoguanine DNA glycosylase
MRMTPGVIERAAWLPGGPATLRLDVSGDVIRATAWGAGAREALESVEALVGERDDTSSLVARHAIVRDAARRLAGLRLTRGAPLFETLLIAILGQKITSLEQRRSFAALVKRFGEPAPGPLGLRLLPRPDKLARLPYWAFHPLGIERRRADTIRAVAAVADTLARFDRVPAHERIERLTSISGVGPWTAGEAIRMSFGDPDAVSVGDYHLPGMVCWALAAETSGTDERMLELLEPYRGQRARVVLLLENAGVARERHGPRMAPRRIAAI